MVEPVSQPPPMPRRSVGSIVLRLLLVMVLLAPTGAVALWCSLVAAPTYWREVDFTDPGTYQRVEVFAEKLDRALLQERPADQVWEMELKQEELRDWVALRMPQWLEDHGVVQGLPPWLHQPMIAFKEGRIILAGLVRYKSISQIVSLTLQPQTGADGEPQFNLAGAAGGRLPLPTGDLFNKLIAKYGSIEAAEEAAFVEAQTVLNQVQLPCVDLGDGRKVRIVDIDLRSCSAVLKCRTIQDRRELAAAIPGS